MCGTVSSEKNEILFSEFNTNYNNEPVIYKKGTTLLRKRLQHPKHGKYRVVVMPFHEDLIQDSFWQKHKEILNAECPNNYELCEEDIIPELVSFQLHITTKKVSDNNFENLDSREVN